MKILLSADLQFHNHGQFSTRLPNGLNSRLVDQLNIVEQMIQVCKEERIDQCWFLGDVYHNRTKLDIDVAIKGYEAFKRLAAVTRLSVLLGNHDCALRNGDIYSIEAFREFCEVVDVPYYAGYSCHPYTADTHRLKEWLKGVPEGCELIFLHATVSEAIPGADDLGSATDLHLSDIPFDRCRYVIAGDIHKGQWLHDGKMLYVGSPMQLTFGERHDEKHLVVLDTDTWSFKFIPTVAPRFFWVTDAPCIPDGADPDKDFIRVEFDSKYAAKAHALKNKYPRIELLPRRLPQSAMKLRLEEDAMRGGDKELLQGYVKSRSTKDLDAGKLVEIGLQYLQS